MTKEENPQTQERDFPLSWKAQTPRFPHSHRTATAAVLASTPNQNHKHGLRLLATFPTYPQIPRRRLFIECFNRITNQRNARIGDRQTNQTKVLKAQLRNSRTRHPYDALS
jgi:hypothetical protein